MQKFLIIQTAFIGDVILATPVISALKSIFPESEIDFLVRKGNENLLLNNPNLKNIYILDKEKKWKSIFNLIKVFRRKKYTEIINLHRFASSGLISILSNAKKVSGFKKNPFSLFYSYSYEHKYLSNIHEVDRNLLCISHHKKFEKIKPNLFPSNDDINAVKNFIDASYVCMFPSSVWFTKQLPVIKWIELNNLISKKYKILLLGSQKDYDLCEEIKIKSSNSNCLNIAGRYSLLQVAELIKKSKLNFVNDSGPLHIASAMNSPCVAFFCSTSTSFGFTPLSDFSLIVEKQPKPDCKPCGLHGFKNCPKNNFVCGDIDIKDLFSKIEYFL